MVIAPESLSSLSAQELREMVTGLMARITERDETIACKDREIVYRQTKIDQLTHEMAVLKRWKFGRSREQLDPAQASLLDEAIDADIDGHRAGTANAGAHATGRRRTSPVAPTPSIAARAAPRGPAP